jgi:hypothetical protein
MLSMDTVKRKQDTMESRMRRKSHVRFGERHGGNRVKKLTYGVSVPTPRDPSPSPEDVRVTEQIVGAGKLLDIDVLDHLIIGQQRFVSLKERGLGFS